MYISRLRKNQAGGPGQPGPFRHPGWLAAPWRADGARDGHARRRLEWPAKAEALGTWGAALPRPHFIMVQAQQRHVLDIVTLEAGGGGAGGSYRHWCDLP